MCLAIRAAFLTGFSRDSSPLGAKASAGKSCILREDRATETHTQREREREREQDLEIARTRDPPSLFGEYDRIEDVCVDSCK